jgi:hypothetical protein
MPIATEMHELAIDVQKSACSSGFQSSSNAGFAAAMVDGYLLQCSGISPQRQRCGLSYRQWPVFRIAGAQ